MVDINTTDSREALRCVNEFMRFVFFPVGHGCCTLVSLPPEEPGGDRIYGVIDCRDATARPIQHYLSNPWFEGEVIHKRAFFKLRFVMLTHYDEDHFIGINHLLGKDDEFMFDHFFCPFPPPGAVAERIPERSRKKERLSEIQDLVPDDKQSFLYLRQDCSGVYHPQDNNLRNIFKAMAIAPSSQAMKSMKELKSLKEITLPNILSSAIRFQWGKCSVIIAGDVEEDEWEKIIDDLESRKEADLLSANIALCSHHGGEGNPDDLWQRISRCSSFHKQRRETERRVSRTLIVVPCGRYREQSPSKDTLRTFFNANSLVRCTSPAKTCLSLHEGEQPSCICDNNDDTREEPIELPPGVEPRPSSGIPVLPHAVNMARNYSKFKKRSICVDIFPERPPKIYFHNGTEATEITERCSCATKLEGAS